MMTIVFIACQATCSDYGIGRYSTGIEAEHKPSIALPCDWPKDVSNVIRSQKNVIAQRMVCYKQTESIIAIQTLSAKPLTLSWPQHISNIKLGAEATQQSKRQASLSSVQQQLAVFHW